MATRKTAQSKSTAIAKWDEELAAQAAEAAKQEESLSGGQFFSVQGGRLSFNDAPIPNNEMAVIILDGILENVYYDSNYDPDDPRPPKCFAFGRAEDDMTPHTVVMEAGNNESDACKGCPMNEWGSADVGRGKACRNSRRLAMISAGSFDEDGRFEMIEEDDHFQTAQIAYMRLPVTSIKGYATFVKQIASGLKRPPHGVITKVTVVPDAKTQFRVVFEPISKVPNEVMGVIMERHEEAKSSIEFPYALPEDDAPPPKKGGRGGRGAAQPVARGAAKSAKTTSRRKY
jgi:hypothetical protein